MFIIATVNEIIAWALIAVFAYALYRGYMQRDNVGGGRASCGGCPRRDCMRSGPTGKGGGDN